MGCWPAARPCSTTSQGGASLTTATRARPSAEIRAAYLIDLTCQAVGEARETLRADRLVRPVAHLAALGAEGLRRAAGLCVSRAHECQRRLTAIEGFDPRFRAPCFKEFVVESAIPPEDVAEELLLSNILGALPLQPDYPEMDHCSLFAVTERRSQTDVHMLCHSLDLLVDFRAELE